MSRSATATEREIATAGAAVRAAAQMCAATQGRLLAGQTIAKSDNSPVTIADLAAQAIVAELLAPLGPVEIVGEEDSSALAADAAVAADVLDLVRGQLGADVTAGRLAAAIDRCGGDGTSGRFWTLDPIDGTKGFLRGDQYAIALALIEDGEVTIGALGCPNLPNPDGSRGAIFVASPAGSFVYEGAATEPRPIRVSDVTDVRDAVVCESVESGHSDHGRSARITEALGISREPFRIDSQCKYAAVARGDASIYLRLPTSETYREKVWDHAAGMYVVERAGGRVTDVEGHELDFTHGRRLERNRGIVATSGRFHDAVRAAVAEASAAPTNDGVVGSGRG